jgi:hypothetical protein
MIRALALLLALCAAPAFLQALECADRATVIERLADGYGERRTAQALGETGGLVEIYANWRSGTWTITVTAPGGPTCLVAQGTNWSPIAPPKTSPPKGDLT